jgi:hypothetical protein
MKHPLGATRGNGAEEKKKPSTTIDADFADFCLLPQTGSASNSDRETG